MKPLLNTAKPLLLRTDFTNDSMWQSLCKISQALSKNGFQAEIECLNDPEYDGVSIDKILSLVPKDTHPIIFVADNFTISESEHPILCIDLMDEPSRTFRVVPSEMWGVENNLSLANMDFVEFLKAVDSDGIFRGFQGE